MSIDKYNYFYVLFDTASGYFYTSGVGEALNQTTAVLLLLGTDEYPWRHRALS